MKIVVTGHLGTIGQPLVTALRAKGHTVYGVDIRHHVDGIRADVADFRQLERAVSWRDVDVVYHLAAEFGRHNGEEYYEQVWRTNAIGTKNILKIQSLYGFKLIFASSSEVYGERHADLLTENMITTPELVSNDYAISKIVNEGQIINARKQWGNQIMTLRFFNAYGPGEFYHAYRSVVCLFAYRALTYQPYTVYEGYHRVFQYIDDLVATLVRAATRFVDGGTINVGGEEYMSVQDLHNEIVKHVPQAVHLAHFLPKEEHNVVSKRPDISKAKFFLGHNPKVTLAEGVPKTLDWMREVYKL